VGNKIRIKLRPVMGLGANSGPEKRRRITSQQPRGIKTKIVFRFFLKELSPNVFIGGPVPATPGFPIEAFGNALNNSSVIPGGLAIASATRNQGKSKTSGYPLSRV
jgi:hypothetical protein